ncbi:MAG: ABC transporter permease [Oscillospiraceae bacterium]|jgi:spermidine/putrescine transport system permease protein|nr:ABC transporter permease [Oscillospiraceae bacterium]
MKQKKTWLCIPLYAWAVLFVGLPLLYVVGVSFFERNPTWGVSDIPTLDNYRSFFDPTYLAVFGKSIGMATLTSALTMLVGYPFAYAMAKSSPKRRTMLMLLVIAPFWTSALIRTYGWIILLRANGPINSILRALGWIDRPLKLLYTEGAVLLGFVYTLLPFMILPSFTAIDRMDWRTVEASRDLGASPARAFLTVTLPLTLPGIISGLTLIFVPSMGMFFIADLMGGGKTMLMGNLIQEQLLKARNTPLGSAFAVLMMGLTAIVLWAQRRAGGETTLF